MQKQLWGENKAFSRKPRFRLLPGGIALLFTGIIIHPPGDLFFNTNTFLGALRAVSSTPGAVSTFNKYFKHAAAPGGTRLHPGRIGLAVL